MFFKEPVQNRDHELNPVFIVADYEVRTGGEDQTAAGLRVAAKFADDRSRSAPAPCTRARRPATPALPAPT